MHRARVAPFPRALAGAAGRAPPTWCRQPSSPRACKPRCQAVVAFTGPDRQHRQPGRAGILGSDSSSAGRLQLPGSSTAQPAPAGPPLPPVVNWHLEARCNYACKFCFATFEDVKQHLIQQGQPAGQVAAGHQLSVGQLAGAGSRCSPSPDSTGAGAGTPSASAAIYSSVRTGGGVTAAPSGEGAHTREQLMEVPHLLALQGASRLSFVGGEPLLHPHIYQLIAAAKQAGLSTSMVTNASLLDASALLRLAPCLDWLAVSVDASSDALHASIGRGVRGEVSRGRSSHLARVKEVWGLARELGFRLKLNTVVTRATLHDDMAPLVAELQPERWKVFQVLPIEGQNDGSVDALLISPAEFQGWVDRHQRALLAAGSAVPLVAESNEAMQGSYAMLDAGCRFFSNSSGRHLYGPSIFDPDHPQGDVAAAWAGVSQGFDARKFGSRGGVYDWGQGHQHLQEQSAQWQPASSSELEGHACAHTCSASQSGSATRSGSPAMIAGQAGQASQQC